MPDAIKIIQLFNNVQMYDCKTARKRLTEGRAGCPNQLWPAARSAERARTCCPGRSTQGAILPERITGRRLPCAGHSEQRPASDRKEVYRRWQPDARCARKRAARTGPGNRPRLRIAGNGLPASTLVEILILMILSGVVFLSVMDGLGLLRRFLDRTAQRIAERTEQYAGYFRTVDLAGDSDSLISEGERTLALYRKGGIHARLSLADSALIVRQDERSDTLLRNVVRRSRTRPRSADRYDDRRAADRAGFRTEHRIRVPSSARSAAREVERTGSEVQIRRKRKRIERGIEIKRTRPRK